MSIPRYRTGERVRVTIEGVVTGDVADSGTTLDLSYRLSPGDPETMLGAMASPCQIYLDCPDVQIERLAPADGEPQPGQLWADATGEERYAYQRNGAVSLLDERGVGVPWQSVHRDPQLGPITRVYPLPAVAAPQPEADEPRAPRPMLDDVWGDDSDDEWTVIRQDGRLLLTWDGETRTWESADSQYGPLTLIERAGYRRTTDTAPIDAVARTLVVSCEAWEDGAPVTITGSPRLIVDDACRLEVEYRPLGGDGTTVVAVDPDMQVTLWAGQAVTSC